MTGTDGSPLTVTVTAAVAGAYDLGIRYTGGAAEGAVSGPPAAPAGRGGPVGSPA